MPDHAPLPQTVVELHALVLEQQASMAKMRQEIAERDREIVERDQELERLKAQIDKLRRMHFGRKSEQVDRQIDRLETQLEDLAAGSGVADVRRARARASSSGAPEASAKEALPDHLTREERVLEPDSICPKCDNAMDLLGEGVSEQLARVTAMFKVIRTIRHKRICTGCGHIVQPPMPGLPIERSIAHPSLLAEIIVSKYANHTPLYRQSEIAARDGVRLDRATMSRWVGQCEELCRLLTEALRRYTMSAAKLHADDTPIPVLAPGNRKTKTGRLWVYVRDDRALVRANPLLSGSRGRRQLSWPACCLTKECYPTDCCRFRFLSSFLSWFSGREAPGPHWLSTSFAAHTSVGVSEHWRRLPRIISLTRSARHALTLRCSVRSCVLRA